MLFLSFILIIQFDKKSAMIFLSVAHLLTAPHCWCVPIEITAVFSSLHDRNRKCTHSLHIHAAETTGTEFPTLHDKQLATERKVCTDAYNNYIFLSCWLSLNKGCQPVRSNRTVDYTSYMPTSARNRHVDSRKTTKEKENSDVGDPVVNCAG